MRSHPYLAATAAAVGLACTSPNDGQLPALQVKGAVAVSAPAEVCDFSGNPVTVTALAVLLSPSADGASLAAPANLCRQTPNETTVNLVLWATGAGAPATFATGIYALRQDASGGLVAFQVRLDGACSPTPPNVPAQGGTITLASVDAQRVTGRVDLAFADGRSLATAFDAAIVPAGVTGCQVFNAQGGAPVVGCATRTCTP